MKFIKRRYEGEYTNTHFIMWQKQKYLFRLFINLFFRKQIIINFYNDVLTFQVRTLNK